MFSEVLGIKGWLKRVGLLIFLTLVAIAIFQYLIMSHSTSFKVARAYIMEEKMVENHVGEIKSIRLNRWSFTYRKKGATAKYRLNLRGDENTIPVVVDLRKEGENWEVFKAVLFPNDPQRRVIIK